MLAREVEMGAGRGILSDEETGAGAPETRRERVSIRPGRDAADFEDGDAETHERTRGEGARRAVLPDSREGTTAGVLPPHDPRDAAIPRGVRAHDGDRPRVHREKAR